MVPLHAAAIAVLIRVAGWGRDYDPWLRLTAFATLAQHGVALAYPPYARYYYLTWLLTLLVVLVWARREGLRLLRRYLPSAANSLSLLGAETIGVRGLIAAASRTRATRRAATPPGEAARRNRRP